ncbi:hypothetical protein IFM89_006854 [Coptis chinensis]|uniref:Uncharacterized protein n=1 Tax=Coptis chinensis TaxID=261450 RepID=A0A835HSB9_9MAGN|nr:hypothetical protein IFM89_006854 [Coptis chinensis]
MALVWEQNKDKARECPDNGEIIDWYVFFHLPKEVVKLIGCSPPKCIYFSSFVWDMLKKGVEAIHKCEDMVNKLELFYANETKEGVATTNLKYILQCENLKTLVLTQNFQSKVMPAVEDLKFENLTALVIAYCGLTGSIPQCVAEKFHQIVVVGYIVESLEWNHSKLVRRDAISILLGFVE